MLPVGPMEQGWGWRWQVHAMPDTNHQKEQLLSLQNPMRMALAQFHRCRNPQGSPRLTSDNSQAAPHLDWTLRGLGGECPAPEPPSEAPRPRGAELESPCSCRAAPTPGPSWTRSGLISIHSEPRACLF